MMNDQLAERIAKAFADLRGSTQKTSEAMERALHHIKTLDWTPGIEAVKRLRRYNEGKN